MDTPTCQESKDLRPPEAKPLVLGSPPRLHISGVGRIEILYRVEATVSSGFFILGFRIWIDSRESIGFGFIPGNPYSQLQGHVRSPLK